MNDDKILTALAALHAAAADVNQLWDHTGTNMIDGYPPSLPSFDEFVADLSAWHEEQRRIRTAVYHLESGDYNAEITYRDFIEANQDSLHESEIESIKSMIVGQDLIFGGGSAGTSTLRRVK